ncbi:hypothetical protein PRZ48_008773 [Zasmidium cellare]|uniref:Uncharacterized protein n=1 Tax=Zasmidium cellare TaxID=395010 RepID=A0ABR0EGE0_ZASCE|nr:hypothetical protein PRZ48_008773 [Zasmidium cellare]
MAYTNIYDMAPTTTFATGLGDELGRAIAYDNTLQIEEQRLQSMSDEILEREKDLQIREQAVQQREEEMKSKECRLQSLEELMSDEVGFEFARRYGRMPTWEDLRLIHRNSEFHALREAPVDGARDQTPLQSPNSPVYTPPSPTYDPDRPSARTTTSTMAGPLGSPLYHAQDHNNNNFSPASPVGYTEYTYSNYDGFAPLPSSDRIPAQSPKSPVYRPDLPAYRPTSPVYRPSSPVYENDIETEIISPAARAYYGPTSPSYEMDITPTANPPETQVYHNTEYFNTILSPASPVERDHTSFDHNFDATPLPGDKYMPLPAVMAPGPPSKSFWDVV